jgi:putative ABC transport system substrate-binding protein
MFWSAMREAGWIEGQGIEVQPRYATSTDQLNEMAADLIRSGVDLIMTDSTAAARAAKRATTTLPIVFNLAGDPVANDLVASLSRPGGNLTGFWQGLYAEKMLATLKSALPKTSRIAVASDVALRPELERAAAELRVELRNVEVATANAFARFFEIARRANADAVMISNVPFLMPALSRIGGAATHSRFPAIAPFSDFVKGGGLLAYGPVPGQQWARMADQVDKILRGAKPAEIPVELPTRFSLAVNLAAAKALGVTLSPETLLRADEVVRE